MTRRALSCLLTTAWLMLCGSLPAQAQVLAGPPLNARAWILYDTSTTQVLAEQNADARIDPGALSRLMLAYVSFNALRDKAITPERILPEPPPSSLPELHLFPLSGQMPVSEAMQAMLLADPSDAARALAVATAGNEAACYALMDQEAQRLGLSASQFHSLGPSVAGHYSTVRDLVRLATVIERDHPGHLTLFRRQDLSIGGQPRLNANRLLWLDPTVDGLLAGENGLAVSATRGPRHLIAVVVGTSGRTILSQEALRLLNSGFQDFDTVRVYSADEVVEQLEVRRGSLNLVKVGFLRDLHVAIARGRASDLRVQLESRRPLLAPLHRGDRVGSVTISLDGRPVGSYPLVALEEIPLTNWLGRQWDDLRLWLKQEK